MKLRIALVVLAFTAGPALAEDTVPLKPGAGLDETSVQCAACHTLNYIRMNSPFLTKAGWTAEVTKMRKVFGAPIDEPTANAIIEYLAANYGVAGK